MSGVGLPPSPGGRPPHSSPSNKRKRDKTPITLFYYPLYTGYSFPAYPPLFKHPSHAAAWAISRFMKDGLSNIWGEKSYPDFMHYVGLIKTRQKDRAPLVIRGNNFLLTQTIKSSKREDTFFEDVIFYLVSDVKQLSKKECGYTRLESEVFQEVLDCFNAKSDYMLSSNSIYKKTKLVVTSPPPDRIQQNQQYKNNVLEQKLKSSSKFIRLEEKLKYLVGDIDAKKLEKIILESVRKYCSQVSRLIVSIGAGRAENEMNSNDFCICLDKDKKSLYSCAFALKYLVKTKSPTVFGQYNMMSGRIINLLESIKTVAANLPVHILFQHPSPSKANGNRSVLNSTFLECIKAQREQLVEGIHFVYDSTQKNMRGTSWGGDELYNMVRGLCDTGHHLTTPSIISEGTDECVNHPLFGKIERRGWASMKNGIEMSFSVSYKLN